ncbi:AraC family transcriptional regulator [Bacillus sp. NP157]|nr:AraC family transcriptional regulator [Bacillus sp. NP157]
MTDDRFRHVLAYIDSHLDDVLSLDVLATQAAYSPFHFHRRFAALTGMGVHRYVQLSRFKRAAWQAAFRADVPVTAMALDAGYESPEAFARAFRQRLGQSPSAFREQPDWARWARAWHDLDQVRRFHMPVRHAHDDVRIVDFPETPVACLSHVGPPGRIGETIRTFIAWRRANHLPPAKAATWNLVYDDPDDTPPETYRMDICCTCANVLPNTQGVVAAQIDGGRCAVLRHVGADAQLIDSVRFLYGEWLSATDETPRDAPLFFQRVAFFPDVPEHAAITDIYLPIV